MNPPPHGKHVSEEQLKNYFIEAFHEVGGKRVRDLEVTYYPYSGINHTLRVRNGKILARISAICSDLPRPALKGLAYMLTARLLKKKVDPRWRDVYNKAIEASHIIERAQSARKSRGRRNVSKPDGDIYDLDEIFDRMNKQYFAGKIERPKLGWSTNKTYRMLGQHDSTHKLIILSKSLDDPSVPSYVVDYVVFHEMLHIAHPTKIVNGRRMNHTPTFRRDEKKFKHYRKAEMWIGENSEKIKRKVRREQRAKKSSR
jgi:hypothetical protein